MYYFLIGRVLAQTKNAEPDRVSYPARSDGYPSSIYVLLSDKSAQLTNAVLWRSFYLYQIQVKKEALNPTATVVGFKASLFYPKNIISQDKASYDRTSTRESDTA